MSRREVLPMIFFLELALLVLGVVVMIAGRLPRFAGVRIKGPAACLLGLIWVLPLVLSFGVGLVLGLLTGVGQIPVERAKVAAAFLPYEVAALVLCPMAFCALAFWQTLRLDAARRRGADDEDELEGDEDESPGPRFDE